MSISIFNAKATPRAVNSPLGDLLTWDVVLSVQDFEGLYTAQSAQIGDFVFLDTSGYETGTITKYVLTAITSATTEEITGELTYDPSNDNASGPPDLSYVLDQDGFICRPTPNKGFSATPSPSVQGLADKFGIYVRNAEFKEKLDLNAGGGSVAIKDKDGATVVTTASAIQFNGYSAVTDAGSGQANVLIETNKLPNNTNYWARKFDDSAFLPLFKLNEDDVAEFGSLGNISRPRGVWEFQTLNKAVGLGVWKKFTLSNLNSTAPDLTKEVNLLTLEPNQFIDKVIVKHATAFSGGSVSGVSLSVGIDSSPEFYTSSFDISSAVSGTNNQYTQTGNLGDFENSTVVKANFSAVGGNLNELTEGIVNVWVHVTTLS